MDTKPGTSKNAADKLVRGTKPSWAPQFGAAIADVSPCLPGAHTRPVPARACSVSPAGIGTEAFASPDARETQCACRFPFFAGLVSGKLDRLPGGL